LYLKNKKNEQIRTFQVSVVSNEGKMLGVFSKREALEMARNQGLDLVEVNSAVNPPICKIADYGRMMYDLNKSRKPVQKTELKTVQFRPVIGDNDLETKIRKIREFLEDNHKVCLSMRFKGREIAHQELGLEVLDQVVAAVRDQCKVVGKPSLSNKVITMMIE
jgi:translation initiation factor IF-3